MRFRREIRVRLILISCTLCFSLRLLLLAMAEFLGAKCHGCFWEMYLYMKWEMGNVCNVAYGLVEIRKTYRIPASFRIRGSFFRYTTNRWSLHFL